jgi:hypothetical protein
MPSKAVLPWLVPIGLALLVGLFLINVWLAVAYLGLVLLGGLPYLRYRYLQQNPPDPELPQKRFGGFR